jgi:RND family efflux transporter MFP subunit
MSIQISKNILILSIFIILSSVPITRAEIYESNTKDQNKTEEHSDHEDHNKSDEHDEHNELEEHVDHKDHNETEKHDEHNQPEKHDDHDGHSSDMHTVDSHDEHEENRLVKLTLKQQLMAGIKVETINPKSNLSQIVSAPGEVVNDLYNTTLLTTQVNSKVLNRQIFLGQFVKKGDVIAVLYSLDIATAQNQLKVSTSEWQRVRKLGKKSVGEKRFVKAKADYEKDKSLLLAYGFNANLIHQLLSGKNQYKSGQYPVLAPHNGVILEDNFQTGQFLPTGSTIALLVNEDNVWVEALISPEIGQRIPVGTKARVLIDGKNFLANVIHDSHTIDEVTRTRKIRLSIDNTDHILHAGLFANIFLKLPLSEKIILLPETALMRSSDGDWTVFIEIEAGVFIQEEVELENTINGLHSIKGLKSGQRIATKGAFFLASEIAKGGFDPHNH